MNCKFLLTAVATATASLMSSCMEEVPRANVVRQTIVAELAEPSETLQSRTCVDVKNTGASTTFTGLLWQPTDKIGVFSSNGSENALFTNTATENAAKTEFSG